MVGREVTLLVRGGWTACQWRARVLHATPSRTAPDMVTVLRRSSRARQPSFSRAALCRARRVPVGRVAIGSVRDEPRLVGTSMLIQTCLASAVARLGI